MDRKFVIRLVNNYSQWCDTLGIVEGKRRLLALVTDKNDIDQLVLEMHSRPEEFDTNGAA